MKLSIVAAALLAAGGLAAGLAGGSADAAGRWRLDFEPGDFSTTVVGSGTTGRVQYYLPYTVTNGSEDGRAPALRLEVRTERKTTHGDYYDARAFASIAKSMKRESVSSTADLRKSELGAGDSASAVAHFGSMDDNSDELAVHVNGLWDPVVRDLDGKLWNEKRVLVLKYRRYGDEYRRYEDPIQLVSRTAIVEEEPGEIQRDAKGR